MIQRAQDGLPLFHPGDVQVGGFRDAVTPRPSRNQHRSIDQAGDENELRRKGKDREAGKETS